MMDCLVSQKGVPLSLREWASENRLTYRTAWRMFREHRLPKSLISEQLPTGTIRLYPKVDLEAGIKGKVVIYARINPRQCPGYLSAQIAACKSFCFSSGWVVSSVVSEIAPAVGSKRLKLTRLLSNPPSRIVVLTEGVLSRFDFTLIEQSLARSGCMVTVLDKSHEKEGEGGALEDLIDAISSTCVRHYGIKRGALLVEALTKLIRNKSL